MLQEEEEYRALAEGELLATSITRREVSRLKEWYMKERSRQQRERRQRMLTGAGWKQVVDPVTNAPFWLNSDTGEASYARPKIVEERVNMEKALQRGYVAMPIAALVAVYAFLEPYPDRMRAARVCARWRDAAAHPSFQLRVLPVESGARDAVAGGSLTLAPNTCTSVSEALARARPGQTIVLGSGHHWEGTLRLTVPVRIVSEAGDPARCVLELTGEVAVDGTARAAELGGVTLRHPRKVATQSCVTVTGGAKVGGMDGGRLWSGHERGGSIVCRLNT